MQVATRPKREWSSKDRTELAQFSGGYMAVYALGVGAFFGGRWLYEENRTIFWIVIGSIVFSLAMGLREKILRDRRKSG